MGPVTSKPVFGVSDKPVPSATYIDQLEYKNFACSMFRDDTFQNVNNKGADQSARMRRLVCAFVHRKPPKIGFLASGPICM